jgi:hypothetical protein
MVPRATRSTASHLDEKQPGREEERRIKIASDETTIFYALSSTLAAFAIDSRRRSAELRHVVAMHAPFQGI